MKVTFDSNYVALCLRLCLVCVKAFLENIPFLENAIFRKCYFPERKMFSCVWLHFKKFSEKYFLMFGKEEGKHKSRKIQATTQKKTSTTMRDHDLRSRSTARSRFRSGAISRRRRSRLTARSRSTAQSCDGEIAFDASPLARVRSLSLSLIFWKCFEGKIEV